MPVAYEEDYPFPYNNFVYSVNVDKHESSTVPPSPQQPGTHPIPVDESTFIFRMPNPISGYNDKVRVENEVAALSLAREALRPNLEHIVPRVYGWASAKGGNGWVLQERMPGDVLVEDFEAMDKADKAVILGQMADILACLQRFELPGTIGKYGGLAFDASGNIVSTALSIFHAGPFSSYHDLLRGTIQDKLEKVDADPWVRGWRDNGIRDRLDKFLSRGLTDLLKDISSLDKTLVHADFSTDNVLYDKSTKKLTALVDFDFGHVGTVADEFFRSLGHGIGRFPDTRDGDPDMIQLHNVMLYGFPDPLPENGGDVDWVAAKAWDDALRERSLQRPATIPCMTTLADVFWLSSQILPWKLCNEVVVGNSTEEQLRERKSEGETLLGNFLTYFGY